jgi:UDP-N-acetylglucosamine 2-epimerase (non-hydrolysing)
MASDGVSRQVTKVLLVFGTRPEALKMAPLIHAMSDAADFDPVVAVTGQHREMLDSVLDLFGIVPAYDLDVMQSRQSLASLTSRVLDRLEPIVTDLAPDMIAVQGDTTSTFVGALAGFYHQIPVTHVEAGLRTGNALSPYPEEMNRRLTSQLTDLHLAPTNTARANLLADGINADSIVVTGNTIIDALLHTASLDVTGYGDPTLADLDAHEGPVLLVTIHRRESWGEAQVDIGRALADIARAEPSLQLVFPIHLNPVVRDAILPSLHGLTNVRVVEPLPYDAFVRLMRRCTLVVTDSGGIQEEAPTFGKPVLVARDTTERPEAVAAGTARLVGTDRAAITAGVLDLMRDPAAYAAMANAVNPYGDGQAARRSLGAIRHHLGTGPDPEDFFRSPAHSA